MRGETGGTGPSWKMFVYWKLGFRQDMERFGISAGVVLGSCGRWGQWLVADKIRCGFGDVRRTFCVIAEVC
jgi:hypothetical protein